MTKNMNLKTGSIGSVNGEGAKVFVAIAEISDPNAITNHLGFRALSSNGMTTTSKEAFAKQVPGLQPGTAGPRLRFPDPEYSPREVKG